MPRSSVRAAVELWWHRIRSNLNLTRNKTKAPWSLEGGQPVAEWVGPRRPDPEFEGISSLRTRGAAVYVVDHVVRLSQAHVTALEVQALRLAVTSGWVAPLGPEVDGFEADICAFTGAAHALALTSGTAAIHLGLLGLGVKPGDDVIVPTLTFGATAFAVTYTGAKPVFVDVDEQSWGLDPEVLEAVLDARAHAGRQVAAIIPVDLFGRPADYDRILPIAAKYGVPCSSMPLSRSARPTATAPPARWARRASTPSTETRS